MSLTRRTNLSQTETRCPGNTWFRSVHLCICAMHSLYAAHAQRSIAALCVIMLLDGLLACMFSIIICYSPENMEMKRSAVHGTAIATSLNH